MLLSILSITYNLAVIKIARLFNNVYNIQKSAKILSQLYGKINETFSNYLSLLVLSRIHENMKYPSKEVRERNKTVTDSKPQRFNSIRNKNNIL